MPNENKNMREELINQTKKLSVLTISSTGQTIFQSLISMKVAQTPLTLNNLKTSFLYNMGIVLLETFLEPLKFRWINDIKSWIYSKFIPQQHTEITKYKFGLSLSLVTTASIIFSAVSVILDKLSNSKIINFFNLDNLKTIGTYTVFTLGIEFLDSLIIETLVETINKIKDNCLNNQYQYQDLESSISNQTEDHIINKISYKSLFLTLPFFVTTTGLTWFNESFNNDTNINFEKFLDDFPNLLLYNLSPVIFSLINCMVNGKELPLVSLFSKCNKSNTESSQSILPKAASLVNMVVQEVNNNDNNDFFVIEPRSRAATI